MREEVIVIGIHTQCNEFLWEFTPLTLVDTKSKVTKHHVEYRTYEWLI